MAAVAVLYGFQGEACAVAHDCHSQPPVGYLVDAHVDVYLEIGVLEEVVHRGIRPQQRVLSEPLSRDADGEPVSGKTGVDAVFSAVVLGYLGDPFQQTVACLHAENVVDYLEILDVGDDDVIVLHAVFVQETADKLVEIFPVVQPCQLVVGGAVLFRPVLGVLLGAVVDEEKAADSLDGVVENFPVLHVVVVLFAADAPFRLPGIDGGVGVQLFLCPFFDLIFQRPHLVVRLAELSCGRICVDDPAVDVGADDAVLHIGDGEEHEPLHKSPGDVDHREIAHKEAHNGVEQHRVVKSEVEVNVGGAADGDDEQSEENRAVFYHVRSRRSYHAVEEHPQDAEHDHDEESGVEAVDLDIFGGAVKNSAGGRVDRLEGERYLRERVDCHEDGVQGSSDEDGHTHKADAVSIA